MHSNYIALATILAFGLTLGSTIPNLQTRELSSPIAGYKIEPLQWEVQTTPGGPNITVSGTVEEMHAQLLEINSNYEAEFAKVERRTSDIDSMQNLHKRNGLRCRDFALALLQANVGGFNYVRGILGQPTNGPRSGACSRFGCLYNFGDMVVQ
ncbi:hypothetical protein BCR34DRAFT_661387 [Clohesyomyces aquaticus]|uniref:Uncharacterized protein n=1 Tax=Clohesyomyces aquaticus TaxID=1231657 RepID=A0A1Y2A2F3_9PLEO|nr:hypothetical protein BCR34DRAFT_661387 [Clohesyomyces aquaticus]